MPVEDILNERNDGRGERDVRFMSGSAFEQGGDVPDEAKADDPWQPERRKSSTKERQQQAEDNDLTPLRANLLDGRIELKNDSTDGLSIFNTLMGLLG